MTDPHHPIAAYQPTDLAVGFLLDEDEVELAGLQAAGQHSTLVHGEFEIDVRIQLPEVAQDLRQLREGEVVRGTESQTPAHRGSGEIAARLVVRREDRAREAEHCVTVVGQSHLTSVPHDEVAFRSDLEFADVLADRRLAEPEQLCGVGEIECLGDHHEGLEQNRIEQETTSHNTT